MMFCTFHVYLTCTFQVTETLLLHESNMLVAAQPSRYTYTQHNLSHHIMHNNIVSFIYALELKMERDAYSIKKSKKQNTIDVLINRTKL